MGVLRSATATVVTAQGQEQVTALEVQVVAQDDAPEAQIGLHVEQVGRVAVAEADAELCRLAELRADGMPMVDLVFLGLGEDGHVASLFPNAAPAVLAARGPFLHVTDSPKPPPRRITLTFAALFAARSVWVLASGAGKEAALRASLAPDGPTPLARVLGGRTATRVFTDIAG